MGADLYIRKLSDKCREEHEPRFNAACKHRDALAKDPTATLDQKNEAQDAVHEAHDAMYAEGYFRDSYNLTSVLWRLGLSWWNDVIPMLDDDGNLTGDNLTKFRTMVADAKYEPVTETPNEESIEEWNKYYTEKRARLLAFLDKAIELGEPIDCSL